MRHDWIFAVLADLIAYAERNGLSRLSAKAEEALEVARDEIAEVPGAGAAKETVSGPGGGVKDPPGGRMN